MRLGQKPITNFELNPDRMFQKPSLDIRFPDGSPLSLGWGDDGPEIKVATKDVTFVPLLSEALNSLDDLIANDDAYPFRNRNDAISAISLICETSESVGEFVESLNDRMVTSYREDEDMGFEAEWWTCNVDKESTRLLVYFANGSKASIIARLNDFEYEVHGGRHGTTERLHDLVERSALGLSTAEFTEHLEKLAGFAENQVSVEDWASSLEEVFPEATPQMAP